MPLGDLLGEIIHSAFTNAASETAEREVERRFGWKGCLGCLAMVLVTIAFIVLIFWVMMG